MNFALSWIPKFPNSWKRQIFEIFKCRPIGCTSKFFPIHHGDVENWEYWILVKKHQMSNSEWKLEIFKRTFSHFRTASFNILLNPLILLDVAEELSYNFFSLKDDSVWSPTLHDNIRFKGGPILIEDLVLPKSFWNVQSLLHTMGHCWNRGVWWNYFSWKLVGNESPLVFLLDCEVSLSDMVCV